MFCLLQSSTKHYISLILVVRIMYDLFYSQSELWFKTAAILIVGKQRECAVKPLIKQAVITLNFFLKEILTCIKHFSINIMHIMFQFSKSKRLLSYDQFFYKILISKWHCFLPIRLLRDVTTNFLYHIFSNNYRTYKKTIFMQFTSLMPIAGFFFHVFLEETLRICHANIFRKINWNS